MPLDTIDLNGLLRGYQQFLDCPRTHVVHHLAAHSFVLAKADPSFAEALCSSDLNVADRTDVVWAARLLGVKPLRQGLYGPAAMVEVMRWGVLRGLRHALVGTSPEALESLRLNLIRRIEGLRVVAVHSPPIREITHTCVEQDLRAIGSEVDILWVGLGTPNQQHWAEIARRHRPAAVIATLGAPFDFHSGGRPQAPEWARRSGLGWAFRLATEPSRLWSRYLIGNPRFVCAVMAEKVRSGATRALPGR